MQSFSIADFEGGGVLWLRTAAVVEPRCGDVSVPEPLLNLRNVGVVVERVGSGRCSKRVQTQPVNLDAGSRAVVLHHFVDAVTGHRLLQGAGAVVAHWPEQRCLLLLAVASGLEVAVDRIQRGCMRGHETCLRAFAMHLEVRDATTFLQAADLQVGKLGASQRVKQIHRQDRAIALRLQAVTRMAGVAGSGRDRRA